MKPQLIKVITPNKMLFIKGRLVRTPLEVKVEFENELNLLKSSMKHQGIDFKIEEYKEVDKKEKPKKLTTKKTSKVKRKTNSPKTTLEKIASEE